MADKLSNALSEQIGHFGSDVVKVHTVSSRTTDGNGNIYDQSLNYANHLILYVDAGEDHFGSAFLNGTKTYYNYHVSSYQSWNIGSGVSVSLKIYYVTK